MILILRVEKTAKGFLLTMTLGKKIKGKINQEVQKLIEASKKEFTDKENPGKTITYDDQ